MVIIRRSQIAADWQTLSAAAQQGRLGEILQEGDIIPVTLKNGEQHEIVATQDEHGKWHFIFRNCLADTAQMHEDGINIGGYKTSQMRSYLAGPVFGLLPDDLQAVIVPTKIIQVIDGERVEMLDKLWLPSEAQIFGGSSLLGSEPKDTQLTWYKDARNRAKVFGDYYGRYWLRSANTGSAYAYMCVDPDGSETDADAGYSAGVSPGFRLGGDDA